MDKIVRELVKVAKELIAAKAQHGFDLTDIPANRWKRLLRMIGADEEPVNKSHAWVWKGNGVTIYTANNPITGEYGARGNRSPEVGYAGYIGIEGNEDKVEDVADYIRDMADYIKGESPGTRDFI